MMIKDAQKVTSVALASSRLWTSGRADVLGLCDQAELAFVGNQNIHATGMASEGNRRYTTFAKPHHSQRKRLT